MGTTDGGLPGAMQWSTLQQVLLLSFSFSPIFLTKKPFGLIISTNESAAKNRTMTNGLDRLTVRDAY